MTPKDKSIMVIGGDDRQVIYVNGIKFREIKKQSSRSPRLGKMHTILMATMAICGGLPSMGGGGSLELPKNFDLIKEYEQILKWRENPCKENKSRLTSRQRCYVESTFESTYEKVDVVEESRKLNEWDVDIQS